MPTPEDQLFLHLAVKYRWLDEPAARRVMDQLESLEADGLESTAAEVVDGQALLKPERIRVLREEVAETMQGATRKLTKTAPPATPPPPPTPRAPGAPSTRRFPKPGAAAGPEPRRAPAEPIPGIRILGKIGVGGMAAVFRAESADERRPMALKILLPNQASNPVSRERFLREAELLTRFDHPNLVKGYRWGEHNGLHYLAMEFVDGLSVQDILERRQADRGGAAAEPGGIEEDQALEVILQTARALAYLEEQGIVHRDVKPGNIMITREGGVKLCDLGFAQSIGGEAGREPGEPAGEAADVTCGTPEYMSPEQARGQRDIDIRSDIYALGATLYHMVLGTVPFQGADTLDVMAKQVLAELYTPRVKERLSRHMHYFIEKMMAKEKDIRYQTPREMAEDIAAQIVGVRSIQNKRGLAPADGAERLRALVAPMRPYARPAARPPLRTGLTTAFRRQAPEESTTRRLRRPGGDRSGTS